MTKRHSDVVLIGRHSQYRKGNQTELNWPKHKHTQTVKVHTKHSHSFTQTKTKDKEKMKADDLMQGVDITKLRAVVHPKLPKYAIKRINHSAYHTFYQQWNAALNGAYGAKRVWEFCGVGDLDSWVNDRGAGAGSFTSPLQYFGFNPSSKNTGSATYPATIPGNREMILKKVGGFFDITNESSGGCYIKLHIMKCMKTTAESVLQTYSDVVGYDSLSLTQRAAAGTSVTGYVYGAQGMGAITIPSAKGALNSQYGDMPVLSSVIYPKSMKTMWKCIGTKSIQLAARASTRVDIDILANIYAKEVAVKEAIYSGNAYDRNTIHFVFEWNGVAGVNDLSAASNVNVEHTNSQLAISGNLVMKFLSVQTGAQQLQTYAVALNEPQETTVKTYQVSGQTAAGTFGAVDKLLATN